MITKQEKHTTAKALFTTAINEAQNTIERLSNEIQSGSETGNALKLYIQELSVQVATLKEVLRDVETMYLK